MLEPLPDAEIIAPILPLLLQQISSKKASEPSAAPASPHARAVWPPAPAAGAKSLVSIARTKVSTICARAAASPGVKAIGDGRGDRTHRARDIGGTLDRRQLKAHGAAQDALKT
jgi:hypothetical protein